MNGAGITEFEGEEHHEIIEYHSIQLHEVTRPEQGARWGPNCRTSQTEGPCEPGGYSQNVVCRGRQVITMLATTPIFTLGESQVFAHDLAWGVPDKRLTNGS